MFNKKVKFLIDITIFKLASELLTDSNKRDEKK